MDYSEDHNPSLWPMKVHDGGQGYGFCPGKSTWDNEAVNLFRLFVVVMETGNLPFAGGVCDQPFWVVDFLGWFAPTYQAEKFNSRAKSILGSEKNGSHHRPINGQGRR